MAKTTLERTPALIKVKRLLEAIKERPMTTPEIAVKLSISKGHATEYVEILHASKRIHIKSRTRDPVCGLKARARPVWAAGEGIDAEPLPPVSKKELSRAQYARIKADPARYERMVRNCRERYRRKVFVARPDVAAAWVFKQAA